MLSGLLVASAGLAPAAGGAAAAAEISPLVTVGVVRGAPTAVAVDPSDGSLYVGAWESVGRLGPDGFTMLAGPGSREANDGSASGAKLERVLGIAIHDGAYIADPLAHRVWRALDDGTIHTVAGTGEAGASGDGGNARDALLRRPADVAIGPGEELYIADSDANRIRVVHPADGEPLANGGTITTVAGVGEEGFSGDGGPATAARLTSPFRVAVDPDGRLYILESPGGNTRVRRVDVDGTISTILGGGACEGDGESQLLSLCGGASDIAVDSHGALYVHDRASDALWRLSPQGEPARLPIYLDGLFSLTVSTDGDLYVGRRLQEDRYVVQRVSLSVPAPSETSSPPVWEGRAAGTVMPAAGTGDSGFAGDGGPATEARLAEPGPLAVGPDGTVYVADRLNYRIRSIGADKIVETVAGNGEEATFPPKALPGPAPGDGQLATEVPLRSPSGGLAAGSDGSLYLCDVAAGRVYRVSPLGVISTLAGTGEAAYAGDGGLAIDAALAEPADVAVGGDGSVYIADRGNNRIRRVDPAGVITTTAEIDRPVAVEAAPNGTVFAVAGGRLWRIDTSGNIPTVTPYAGVADLEGIAVGPDGLVYVSSGARVFAVLDDGTTRPVAGTGEAGGRLGREAGSAGDVDLPPIDGIAFDPAGNLYLSHGVANQVTVVVRATDQPSEIRWHWLVLAVVAAVAGAAVALSLRKTRRTGSAPGSATSEPPAGVARP